MMHTVKVAVPAMILAAAMMLWNTASYAKPEDSRKEGKSCTYCHVKTGSKQLNEAGRYYQEHNHSLAGYKAPAK